jgi:hypothetical protein
MWRAFSGEKKSLQHVLPVAVKLVSLSACEIMLYFAYRVLLSDLRLQSMLVYNKLV